MRSLAFSAIVQIALTIKDRGFSEQQYAREAYRQSAKDATIIGAAAIAAVATVVLLAREAVHGRIAGQDGPETDRS
jgi:hypothetical protein